MIIRNFLPKDFEEAENLSRPIYYPKLWEPNDAYSVRIKLFPQGCLAAEDNGTLIGYCFAHPWMFDQIVPLASVVQLPPNPNCLYIHDLAVHQNHRKKGVGKELFNKTLQLAQQLNFNKIKLVSVLNSHYFWAKCGFQVNEEIQYTPDVRGFIMSRFTTV